ncbi:MAG TPA: glycosyltransferase family 4 protein [Geminicoccus sp.]|jgi:glycosyltransferase involved in cell wall biosynthesis|uniref:glycosyltransferase family 4 protein n=1 Tax=Geminicoccus sp. TaxID=2024832 RepID=UPI002E306C43|nr:glycosyltransferase family 4 protein [Geminicoccus sp.]HEX2529628.1 glycosyltransferase family 4 protein [Geminicoccus sp.]
MPVNAAIQFHDDSFRTDQPKLMGRQAATESFFHAWLAHADVDVAVAYVERAADRAAFAEAVRRFDGHDRRLLAVATPADSTAVQATGALFRPDPQLAELAFRRRRGDTRRWSLIGVTHTTASLNAMKALSDLVLGPLEPWDALICTSSSVRAMVKRQIDGMFAYLQERLGASRRPKLNMPVIPLGIDTATFDPATAQAQATRVRLRAELGIAEDDVAVLYLGRLSAYVKAHPLPMFVGLEEAVAAAGGRLHGKVHLIQAGWFTDDKREAHWREGQEILAPSIRHHVLDGRQPEVRAGIRFAADLFASFADNIQETFGLTPVEAMAAGLPVIASDWDGYRETVTSDCGILVPTMMPDPHAGLWLAQRFEDNLETYDTYCATAALATSVDVSAAREAFTSLLTDRERRGAMGQAGRARARQHYDWARVVHAYQELFSDLQKQRRKAAAQTIRAAVNPWRPNPFDLFRGYSTRTMQKGIRLRATLRASSGSGNGAALRLMELDLNQLRGRAPGDGPQARALLEEIMASGPAGVPYETLLRPEIGGSASMICFHIGWLMKLGLVEPVA